MNKLYCNESPPFLPVYTELPDLRSTFIANCIFNTFLIYTTIILNIVTIYAIHKTSTMPKNLKTLLLSLACSDVAVGLFSQPLYAFFLVKLLQSKIPGCTIYRLLNTSGYLFAVASFFGIVAVSIDRFLAVHLHLKYQELVAHKRVVIVVIGIWMYSVLVSSMTFWGLLSTRDLMILITAAFSLIITFVMYIRINLTVRRHKNQMQSMQIPADEAHSNEIKNFAVLIKSIVGVFYVYLVFLICYLPYIICTAVVRIYGSNVVLKRLFLFSWTLVYLNSSLNPVIYCWKIKHIRWSITNILRMIPWNSNRPFRINYNRSSNVVRIDN